MKAQRREVNIFNMSLLDILCGALGAFCFMMLVLFPYWRPAGPVAKDLEKQFEQTQKQMEELKERLKNAGNGEAAKELEKLEERVREQQRQANRAQREAEEARREAERVKERRNALTVVVRWSTPKHDIDLYVRTTGKSTAGKEMPLVDATKKQGVYYPGELHADVTQGPGVDMWQANETVPNLPMEIHYKFLASNANPEPAVVFDAFFAYNGMFFKLPRATFNKEQTSVMVGRLIPGPGGSIKFDPAPEFAQQTRELNPPPK